MSLTSLTLISQLGEFHDRDSWQRFVEIYSPVIRRTARCYGLSELDIDDIEQEVFIQMMRTGKQFRKDQEKGRFKNYLVRMTINKIYDYWRLRKREGVVFSDPAQLPDRHDICRDWEQAMNRQIFQMAMNQVRQTTQRTTWESFLYHTLHKEGAAAVGKRLGLTENSVYVNSSRTLQRIRRAAREILEKVECGEVSLPE